MLLGFSGEQVRDVGRVLDEERALVEQETDQNNIDGRDRMAGRIAQHEFS